MKQKIRTAFFSILSKLVPELRYLKYIYNGSIANSEVHPAVKLYAPYNINHSSIGEGSYIAQNANISQTRIGKYCSIGPNLICGWGIHPINGLSTSPTFYSTKKQNGLSFSKNDKIDERKPIIIGNDVFIGMNVTILDGVKIGDGAVIGAGAVVSKDIPPYAIAVGAPIQVKKYRFKEEDIRKLLQIKWWDFGVDKIKDVEKHFFDAEGFISKYYKNEK